MKGSGLLLLQREVPESVNLAAAQAAAAAGVPVVLDAGGAEGPLPAELLKCVTVLSPNETELVRDPQAERNGDPPLPRSSHPSAAANIARVRECAGVVSFAPLRPRRGSRGCRRARAGRCRLISSRRRRRSCRRRRAGAATPLALFPRRSGSSLPPPV